MNKGRLDRIELKLIDPGIRARKEYRNIPNLANDIKTHGLIHPIAVMDSGDGLFLLLAGGRRLAACQHLGKTMIDCKIFPSNLTEIEIKSIELMENIQRENLTFYEEANLEREIMKLQQQIYGKKISTAPDAEGVSKTDVANMIGVSREKLRQDIELADTMEMFPDVGWKDMKNRAEALKLKKNIGSIVVRQEAIKRFKAETKKPNARIEQLSNSYVCGDFFKFAKQIPDGTIDLVELDPPYAINLKKLKKQGVAGKYSYGETGYNEIEANEYASFMLKTFHECYRVMAQDSVLICWFGPEPWFGPMLEWLKAEKFNVRGIPCLWVKGNENDEGLIDKINGQTLSPARYLANSYEMFFYAKKGDPKIVKQGRTNVFSFSPVSPTTKIHPTERPIDLIREILMTFAEPGMRVLVPFLGSGVTLRAAFDCHMSAFGTDLGEEHKESFMASIINN